ncbi:MAG: hypothetical protein HUU06_07965 [Planctomycetaceae bacterium]|nr:hypothetical protein [Planctomycetota bacterium]NUN52704.1 hypothetical protein [Planctomycetaceae bacterium]
MIPLLRRVAFFALLCGWFLLLGGYLFLDPVLLSLGTFLVGAGYAARQYTHPDPGSFDAPALYCLFAGFWFGLSNFAGYVSRDGRFEDVFWDWQSDDHIPLGQALGSLAVVVPLAVDAVYRGLRRGRPLAVPGNRWDLSFAPARAVAAALLLAGATWTFRLFGIDGDGLGTFQVFMLQGANAAIFLLVLLLLDGSVEPRRRRFVLGSAALILLAEIYFGVFFSFMRERTFWPLFSLGMPFLLRRRIDLRTGVALACALAAFAVLFQVLGETRGARVTGGAKADLLARELTSGEAGGRTADSIIGRVEEGGANLLARTSTFNQLSQVVRLAEEDGFYGGETLSYLAYVFIPRFVWPEKPLVVTGRWFAEKIGRGYYRTGGEFTNSVNITPVGEFYLNFGWAGAVAGMAVLMLLLRVLWDAARFVDRPLNPVGQSIALLALQVCVFTGSHAGVLVDLFTKLLMLLLANGALALLAGRGSRGGSTVVPVSSPVGGSPGAGRTA